MKNMKMIRGLVLTGLLTLVCSVSDSSAMKQEPTQQEIMMELQQGLAAIDEQPEITTKFQLLCHAFSVCSEYVSNGQLDFTQELHAQLYLSILEKVTKALVSLVTECQTTPVHGQSETDYVGIIVGIIQPMSETLSPIYHTIHPKLSRQWIRTTTLFATLTTEYVEAHRTPVSVESTEAAVQHQVAPVDAVVPESQPQEDDWKTHLAQIKAELEAAKVQIEQFMAKKFPLQA